MDYLGIIELGVIFSIFVLGMIISFRLLGFADLTIEGSFTTGGAIFAITLNSGTNPLVSLFLAILGGAIAGFFTAALHCFGGINKLISGIITLTILYTVNLRIMGRSNLYLENTTLLNKLDNPWFELILLVVICIVVFVIIKMFLATNFGLYLRATGENESFVKNLKVKHIKFIISGMVLSNALIALSGCLFTQYIGYSDIGNGYGMLVSMLTAMIIGENILRPTSLNRLILSAFLGAITFQFLYSLALEIGVKPVDLKIMIGFLLIAMLIFTRAYSRTKLNRNIGTSFI